jgi:hypothetical protein
VTNTSIGGNNFLTLNGDAMIAAPSNQPMQAAELRIRKRQTIRVSVGKSASKTA